MAPTDWLETVRLICTGAPSHGAHWQGLRRDPLRACRAGIASSGKAPSARLSSRSGQPRRLDVDDVECMPRWIVCRDLFLWRDIFLFSAMLYAALRLTVVAPCRNLDAFTRGRAQRVPACTRGCLSGFVSVPLWASARRGQPVKPYRGPLWSGLPLRWRSGLRLGLACACAGGVRPGLRSAIGRQRRVASLRNTDTGDETVDWPALRVRSTACWRACLTLARGHVRCRQILSLSQS
jgi:hypothetical protein